MIIFFFFHFLLLLLLLHRNIFLDFDQWGHVSALEQNFNPSKDDIKRRTHLGKCGGGGGGGG